MSSFPISRGDQIAALKDGLGVRFIGPEEAAALLELNGRNRRPSPKTIATYAEDMRRGEWVDTGSNTITLFRDLTTGEVSLVNGQHRLRAIIESGTRQKFQLVLRTSAETTREALYAAMDQVKVRTLGDYFRVSEFSSQRREDSERSLVAAVSAVTVLEILIRNIADGKGGAPFTIVSNIQRTELWHRHEQEARWAAVLRIRQSKGRRRPVPVGLLAAAIACHRVAPDEATEFFTRVVTGADLPEQSPGYVLRDIWLRGGDPERTKSARNAHLYWYGLGINAWNHHCAGDEKIARLMSLDIPRCVIRRPKARAGDSVTRIVPA